MNRNEFKSLIRDVLNETRQKPNVENKEKLLRESLTKLVKKVLSEISSVPNPKPNKDEKETIDKQYHKDGNEPLDKTLLEQAKELEKLVHEINKDFTVYWDDHNDLNVDAKNVLRVRISPKWENNFDVEAFVKMQDRIKAVALTWEQVKALVKANFSEVNKTKVASAKDKAMDHLKDKTEKGDLPQHDKLKRKEVGTAKNDEKDYNEPDVKREEDMQDQPNKEVDVNKIKYQRDFTEKENKVKPPKHKTDKKLVVALNKTKKLKA